MMARALLLPAVLIVFGLSGCASAPVSQMRGNGYCRPSQDLPTAKSLTPVPEVPTAMDDLYGLLAAERKQHAADDRDYNSLYQECVGKP